jgi:protein-tyrosine phosphatase
MGFRHIIDLNADPSEKSLSRVAGVSYHPISTTDEHSVESLVTNMQGAVNTIEQADRHKEKVYLHCTYGRGRSPTMAMAYLVSKDWSVQDAVDHVKKRARLVWNEGNPVLKYEGVLRAYADSLHRRPAMK